MRFPMRRLAAFAALSLAALSAVPAEAQTRTLRRNGEVLILNVRPRSYLDAGNIVPVGSMNYPALRPDRVSPQPAALSRHASASARACCPIRSPTALHR